VIAIVGTTVAPWQLFFQQSNVVDKRITARWIPYGRADLGIGIVVVMVGATALMAVAAFGLTGTAEAGHFTDAGAVAAGLSRHLGGAGGAVRDHPAGRIADRRQCRRPGDHLCGR
jgi:Mn2+/Fe2+ NRAMP family transporter